MLSSAQWRCLVWQSKWFFDCWFRIYFSGPVWGVLRKSKPLNMRFRYWRKKRNTLPETNNWQFVLKIGGWENTFLLRGYVSFREGNISSNKTLLSRLFSFLKVGYACSLLCFEGWRVSVSKLSSSTIFSRNESAIHFFHREGDWTYKHVTTGMFPSVYLKYTNNIHATYMVIFSQ